MKNWFPFTDYDFYAYISAGVIVIAGIDYTLFGAVLVGRAEWTIVQGVFWTMFSYLVGHITAGLSSFALEQMLINKVFCSPVLIILGLRKPRWFERLFKLLFAREYSAFPTENSDMILDKLASSLKCERSSLRDSETIFQTAFLVSRYETTSEVRLNQFMNQYGLCRNVAFAFLLVAVLLAWKRLCQPAEMDGWLLLGSLLMAGGMYGRFLKFYSAYSREILRTFGRKA